MAEMVLTAWVAEAALRETGDASDRVGDNIVNVLLAWPRPGKSDVLGTTGYVPLTDHIRPEDPPDRPGLFACAVLKEKVEGDACLLVHVLERDRQRKWARFLRGLVLGAVEGAVGLEGALARHAFSEAIQEGGIQTGETPDERIDAVAVGEKPVVLSAGRLAELARSGEPERITVPLIAPRDLAHPREKGALAPLRGNGHLVLEVRVTT